jgi:hypothetical protein
MSIGSQVITRRRPVVRVGNYNHKDIILALAATAVMLAFVAIETIGSAVSDTRRFGDYHFGDVTIHAINSIGISTVNVLVALGVAAVIAVASFLIARFPLTDEVCEALSRTRDER